MYSDFSVVGEWRRIYFRKGFKKWNKTGKLLLDLMNGLSDVCEYEM
jgi:hypothetical protein